MIYYLDGYNFFFSRLPEDTSAFEIEKSRLLSEFSKAIQLARLSVLVVFDAYNRLGEFSRLNYESLELVYTGSGQTADEFIIEAISRSLPPGICTVVSNDGKLIREVKTLGGHALKNKAFQKLVQKKCSNASGDVCEKSVIDGDFERYLKAFSKKFPNK